MHRQQWFEKADLPKKMVEHPHASGRKAGSHGRDTLGISAFTSLKKVEWFIICSPEGDESQQICEEMIGSAE
jgi:seryl-tRNA synthetase